VSQQIRPSFTETSLDTFKITVIVMADLSNLCCVVFYELSITENMSYNPQHDEVECSENVGKSKYLSIHSAVFTLRCLTCKWKQQMGYFLTIFLLVCLLLLNSIKIFLPVVMFYQVQI